MKKIELVINEETMETKTYLQKPFIKGSIIREGMRLGKEIDSMESLEEDIIDKLASFVADRLYNGQFTADQLIDGTDARELIPMLLKQLETVFGSQGHDQVPLAEKMN